MRLETLTVCWRVEGKECNRLRKRESRMGIGAARLQHRITLEPA